MMVSKTQIKALRTADKICFDYYVRDERAISQIRAIKKTKNDIWEDEATITIPVNFEFGKKWNEEIKEFIDGKRVKEEGKVQVFTVVDVFVDTVEEGRILANSLMKIVNSNKYEGIKPRARYLYDTEENKGRFLL